MSEIHATRIVNDEELDAIIGGGSIAQAAKDSFGTGRSSPPVTSEGFLTICFGVGGYLLSLI